MEVKQSWNRFLTPAREEDLEDLYKEVMGTSSANTQTEEKPFSQSGRNAKRENGNTNAAAACNLFRAPEKFQLSDAGLSDNRRNTSLCLGQSADVGSHSPRRILRRLSECFRSDSAFTGSCVRIDGGRPADRYSCDRSYTRCRGRIG